MTFANRPCQRCDRVTRQEVSGQVTASGSTQFGWWCLKCRGWVLAKSGGFWIPKGALLAEGVDLGWLPVVQNMKAPRCARCGRRGAEEHHWGPRAIFGPEDAETWPKDYLCKSCHDAWHRRVTPQLVATNY